MRMKISEKHPIISWIPRHVGFLLSRLRQGDDGKTPFTRRTGRVWKQPLILFGGRYLFRPTPSQAETNLDRSTYKPRNSVICDKLRLYLDELVHEHGDHGLTPLRVERGVYVFDFHVDEKVSKERGYRMVNSFTEGGSSGSAGSSGGAGGTTEERFPPRPHQLGA